MPHIHEKIDYTADIMIVHDNRVLLRKHDKYGKWFMVGGHVELDEDPAHAAIREAKEEVGLDIVLVGEKPEISTAVYENIIPPRFMNRHHINEQHDHIAMVYFATSESDQVVAEGSDKSDDWRWLTESELDDPELALDELMKFYARTALAELA